MTKCTNGVDTDSNLKMAHNL